MFNVCLSKIISKKQVNTKKSQKDDLIKPCTILIHGTLFPIISDLVHNTDFPLGFYKAAKHGNKYVHGRFAHILSTSSDFPLDSFYMFGWSGKLCFDAREEAAHELYHKSSKYKGPLTIIAHSHGCNVALNLAKIAKKHNDKCFKIDRLILLACPVQQATAIYAKSEVFKKIYSFYSTADLIQILDPQGLYQNNYNSSNISLFSKRVFEDSPNLIQAKIILYGHSPNHLDFITRSGFIKSLPEIIKMLDNVAQSKKSDSFTVCIDRSDKVHLIEDKKLTSSGI